MTKKYEYIYCGKKFRNEETLKNHIDKFGTHI